jgi:hypothetical protein
MFALPQSVIQPKLPDDGSLVLVFDAVSTKDADLDIPSEAVGAAGRRYH